MSSWDILAGDAKPGEEVLLFDDNGAHPGLQAAEALAEAGARVEIVTPERFFAPEIGGLNHVAYARCFQEHGVRITINTRLRRGAARRQPAGRRPRQRLRRAHAGAPGRPGRGRARHAAAGRPLLRAQGPAPANRGEVDHPALIAGRPQTLMRNPDGRFQLFRIGDAVASRNIHAAIYDSLRLCKDL